MEQDQRKGLLCGLLAAGIRMEGLLRVAIERPEAESEVAPQIKEAFELYRKIFEAAWNVAPAEAPAADAEPEIPAEAESAEAPVAEPVEDAVEVIAEAPEEVVAVPEIAEVAEPADAAAGGGEREVLKLDELIARRESADLRRAFTLNDKFRFRRTLFGGSNELFVEVLDRLESIADGREAQKFLASIIDVESEDGADFMTIVNAHFGIRQ